MYLDETGVSKLGWSEEREALDIQGYSAPLPLAEPERAAAVLAEHSQTGLYLRDGHATSPLVRTLLSDPGLVSHVQRLCGSDFTLWRSAFFSKVKGTDRKSVV